MGAVRNIVWGLLLAGWSFTGSAALAEKRVALVIGNSGYEKVVGLGNPVNDAALVADTLKTAGFDTVDLRRDLKIADMRRALRDFVDKSRDADVAVVYYAGHGIEVDGVNYLIPVDAVLERDIDVYDEAFSLDRILVTIEPARQLRLVILDACRDNPFAKTMKRTIASRAIGRGLAKIEPTSPNTLIAFASKAGSTASDGDGHNSPFTTALVKHVAKPGLDLRRAFGYVRDDVLKATGNRQEPYVYGSLGGDDVPLVPAKPEAVPQLPQADPQVAVRRDYELALQANEREAWEAFLRAYPTGFYADLAKVQLSKIAAEQTRAVAAEKARQAEQEKARLASEGAKKAEQEKAASAAKAAEEARKAAEKMKQIEQEKAAAAEAARAEAERIAAQKAAAEKAAAEKVAAEKDAGEKLAAEQAANKANNEKLAALPPPAESTQPASIELARTLQAELRRVGCNTGEVDGNWSASSQRALDRFNKYSGNSLNVGVASPEAIDRVKEKTTRICPLICSSGYKASGETCVRITCHTGYAVNDDGECEKSETKKPIAKREEPRPKKDQVDRAKLDAAPPKPQASGQVICTAQGCRPIAKGCRLATGKYASGFVMNQSEVCN